MYLQDYSEIAESGVNHHKVNFVEQLSECEHTTIVNLKSVVALG